ncbi:MAG TPA: BPSS1780 family membrane protein [Burkholderiales bacterium]|nr:BPSS1780 family membrane protein [Burkholderiales bacterium]
MQARIVGAAAGARWLADGWRLFRAAPLGWLAAVFGYWLLMTIVSVVPLIGVAAAAILVPAFSVGFMALARAAGRGGSLELALLFDGFRNEPRTQIILGVVYLGCLALLLSATTLVDDGALASWMVTGRRPADDVLQSEAFFGALVTAAALYLPVMMAFWFAPPLAAWHATGAAKALFFSFAASIMNWRAFLAYGVAAAVATLLIPFLALTLLTMASAGALRAPVATLVFPLLLVMLPTLFASFYASYRDVFGYDAAP